MANAMPSFSYDVAGRLVNSGTVLNAAGPGSNGALIGSVIDLGGGDKTVGPSDGAGAVYNGVVVIDLATAVVSTDELYELILVGSQRADMDAAAGLAATPVTYQVPLAEARYGEQDSLFAAAGDLALPAAAGKRILLPFTNLYLGVWYRYIQLFGRVSGTAPSTSIGAFIARLPAR